MPLKYFGDVRTWSSALRNYGNVDFVLDSIQVEGMSSTCSI